MVAMRWLTVASALALVDASPGGNRCKPDGIDGKTTSQASSISLPSASIPDYGLPPPKHTTTQSSWYIPPYGHGGTNTTSIPGQPHGTALPSGAASTNVASGTRGTGPGDSTAVVSSGVSSKGPKETDIPNEASGSGGLTSGELVVTGSTAATVSGNPVPTETVGTFISHGMPGSDGTTKPGSSDFTSGLPTRGQAAESNGVGSGSSAPTKSDATSRTSSPAGSSGTGITSGGTRSDQTASGEKTSTGISQIPPEGSNTAGFSSVVPVSNGPSTSGESGTAKVPGGPFTTDGAAGFPTTGGGNASPTSDANDGSSATNGVTTGSPTTNGGAAPATTDGNNGTLTGTTTEPQGTTSREPNATGPDGTANSSGVSGPSGINTGELVTTGSNGATRSGEPTTKTASDGSATGSTGVNVSDEPVSTGSNGTGSDGTTTGHSIVTSSNSTTSAIKSDTQNATGSNTPGQSIPTQTPGETTKPPTTKAASETGKTTTYSGTITPATSSESTLTITSLPPDATIVTLTDTPFTSPTFITTTASGSDDPTVVPVVIPTTGPPEICFNCIPPVPPHVKIDVPGFCVEIFGLQIGTCPSDTDDNPKSDDEDKPTSTKDKTSEVSSCTTTMVATYESVFCSVTGTSNQDTPECSTQAWTTVTDCSVTNSATTTTITGISYPEPTCAPGTCGGGTCSTSSKAKRGLDSIDRKLIKRIEEDGNWEEPSDLVEGSLGGLTREQKLVAMESYYAYNSDPSDAYKGQSVKFPGDELSIDEQDITTTNYITFQEKVQSLAVQGLHGCTSVVIVSKRGAFASHIWENTFQYEEKETKEAFDQRFDLRTNNEMRIGRADQYSPYGYSELLNNKAQLGYIGTLFGDNTIPNDDPDVRVFIMAPRPRVTYDEAGMDLVNVDGKLQAAFTKMSEDERLSEDSKRGFLAFGKQLITLKDNLKQNLGLSKDIEVIGYSPMLLPLSTMNAYFPKPPPDDVANRVLGDNNQNTARGKLLLQYHPAKSCTEKAAWRVWFEGRPLNAANHQAEWSPEEGQIFQREGAQQKRQACPIKTPSVQTTTTSVTSSATSSWSTLETSTLEKSTLKTSTIAQSTLLPSLTTVASEVPSAITSSAADASATSSGCNADSDCNATFCTENQSASCVKMAFGGDNSGFCLCVNTQSIGDECSSDDGCKGHTCQDLYYFGCQITSGTNGTCQCLLSGVTDIPIPTFPLATSTTSSVATTTSKPRETVTITPIGVVGPSCNKESDFPNHGDVNSFAVSDNAQRFCTDAAQDLELGADTKQLAPYVLTDANGINYEYSITWIEGCKTTVDKQNAYYPLGQDTEEEKDLVCWKIFAASYQYCTNNGGVGGSYQIGCLLYKFRGGVGPAQGVENS